MMVGELFMSFRCQFVDKDVFGIVSVGERKIVVIHSLFYGIFRSTYLLFA